MIIRLYGLTVHCCLALLISSVCFANPAKQVKPSDNPNRFRYVFITGFLNEALVVNFADTIRTLKETGVEDSSLITINLSSSKTAEQNTEALYEKLSEAVKGKRKPLILIAHSKGALETLAFAVRYPDFVEQKVEKIYLVQGVFGGSYVADYTQGWAHPVDSKMPAHKVTEFLALDFLEKILHWFVGAGVRAVTTYATNVFVDELKDAYNEITSDYTDKVFYITSSEKSEHYSKLMSGSGSYLETYYGKNDGLLLVNQQYVGGIGQRLKHYECDHLDLVMNSTVSNKPYIFRRDFTLSLVSHALKN